MSIEVRDVTKTYGSFTALDRVSVSIEPGSLTALLGPSGGGKSTLLRVIAGLETADTGTVEIDGVDATRLPPQRRGVGFVFQHYAAFPHMSVARNVAFGLEIRRRPREEVRARVDELLRLVHLEQFADRAPAQLSGGQRQRMALARALAVEPAVLLLDEPFGALDAKVRKELRDWLRRLHDQVHVTTVFVTHDQDEALEVADRIVLVDHGRIRQVGSPDDLYDRPADEFVMSFLGPVTALGDRLVRPHDLEVLGIGVRDALAGRVEQVQRVGNEVRLDVAVEGVGPSGAGSAEAQRVTAVLTRAELRALDAGEGDTVWLRLAPGSPSLPVPGRDDARHGAASDLAVAFAGAGPGRR